MENINKIKSNPINALIAGYSWRELLLIAGLISYGIGGDPLPNRLNLALVLTGTFLIAFTGAKLSFAAGMGFAIKNHIKSRQYYYAFSNSAFLALLSIGIAGSIAFSNKLDDVVRDIIPHIFLFLSIFVGVRIIASKYPEKTLDLLAILIAISGALISWRFLSIVTPAITAIGTDRFAFDNFLRLSFDPSVLFAAVFFPIYAVEIFNPKNPTRVVLAAISLISGLVALGALGSTVSRGPIILALLSYSGYFLLTARNSIVRLIMAAIAAAVFYIIFASQINGVISLAIQKMMLHGDNGRFDEFRASFEAAGVNVWTAFLGEGWGGLLLNPYRPGANFSFTHNVITYYILKTGLIGTTIVSFYIVWTIRRGFALVKNKPAVFFGSMASLSYCLMIQPTYKSITCGLILALLSTSPIIMKSRQR